MKVGLVDVDGHHFPNLALMRISAWHKSQGDAAGILELTCEEFHGEYRPAGCPIVAVSVAGDSFAVDPTF